MHIRGADSRLKVRKNKKRHLYTILGSVGATRSAHSRLKARNNMYTQLYIYGTKLSLILHRAIKSLGPKW